MALHAHKIDKIQLLQLSVTYVRSKLAVALQIHYVLFVSMHIIGICGVVVPVYSFPTVKM